MTNSPATANTAISLQFNLHELPTAQHKAGLAGLLLIIDDMQNRDVFTVDDTPRIVERNSSSARIEFTQHNVQKLIDELYGSQITEQLVKQKWKGKIEPKRIAEIEVVDEKTKKTTTQKRFVYDVVEPNSAFLRRCFHDPKGNGPWMKLWRNMLWSVWQPQSRGPFYQRAAEMPASSGTGAWKSMLAFAKARKKNRIHVCKISGTQLLGAQAINAEGLNFKDRSDHAFLLHFWILTLQIFVPCIVENDGSIDFTTFSLAIPDINDLDEFCDQYVRMLSELSPEVRGYRPRESVIDIPAEAALQFMLHLTRIVQQKSEHNNYLSSCINSVEYMHIVKKKGDNNSKSTGAGRIAYDPELLRKYDNIINSKPKAYRNPLFRGGLLTALLQSRRTWYAGFDRMLIERPWPIFINSEKTPREIPRFAHDVSNYFHNLRVRFENDQKDQRNHAMKTGDTSEPALATPLELLIHRLIRTYVERKTRAKCGIEWNDFKDKKAKDETTGKERIAVPKAYSDAKSKVASDAFLALRSRREQEFADFFTASICSVGQFLREEEFQTVALALLDEPAQVKTLALLALSANS